MPTQDFFHAPTDHDIRPGARPASPALGGPRHVSERATASASKVNIIAKWAGLSAIAAVMLAVPAEARQGYALRGLFCNSRDQLHSTLENLREASSLAVAIAMTNQGSIHCIHAYKIRYLVLRPVVIGRKLHEGHTLKLYEGSLIGVLVGGNPRPVDPPLKTYFVPMEDIPAMPTEEGT